MGAATKRTAELAFGPTMFALRGIIQNYVIAKDFATPFQDELPQYVWNLAFIDGHNLIRSNGVQMRDQRNHNSLSCITDKQKIDRWFGNGQTMMIST